MFVCGQCGTPYDRGGYCPSDGRPLVETDDPLLGTEIGRYRLTRLLGEGGMGRVYLAVQPAIGSRVAIKVLADQCARSPDLLERFFAEARAVNLIRHESIVSVLDLAKLDDGRPYIVMEFIDGHTLGDLVRAGNAPLGGVVQVMTEMLSALAAAHAIGIVHRDLKPDNVLVTAEGHAKVLDFGIAKLAPGLSDAKSPRTRTGALLGTPGYMAPEQISGSGQIDSRTDVYAAGIVLYESFTGRVPFAGETLFDLMRLHLEGTPPSARALRPDLPVALERIIYKALAKHPDDRFATANDMADALHAAAAELPAEQWRALSARGAPITGGRSITRARSSIAGRTPASGPPAARSAGAGPQADETVRHATSVSTGGWTRRRTALVGALAGAAVVAGVLILLARSPDAPTGQVAAGAPTGSAEPAAAPSGSGSGSAEQGSAEPAPAPSGSAERGSAERDVADRRRAKHGKGDVAGAPVRVAQVTPDAGVVAPHDAAPVAATPDAPTTMIVISGKQPMGPTRFNRPIDYNPKRFDALAYAPKALALAQGVFPDAGLTRFDVEGVYPDGHADLTLPDLGDTSYLFRSPSHSARPTNLPSNVSADIQCYVEVTVAVSAVEVRVRAMDPIDPNCKWPLRPIPRCSMAAVWKKAAKAGAELDTIAKIDFLSDGKWFFDNEFDGKGVTESYSDSCP